MWATCLLNFVFFFGCSADILRLQKLGHESSSQQEVFVNAKSAIQSTANILMKAIQDLKDISHQFSEFDEAKNHFKELALAQTTSSTLVPRVTIDDLGEESGAAEIGGSSLCVNELLSVL